MFSQPLKQQNTFPDLPRNEPLLNQDGTMNHYWMLFFDNLTMALQRTFSPEGFVMPEQTTSDITTYLSDDPVFIANVLYDSTTNTFKGNIFNTADGTPLNAPTGAQHWLEFAMITDFAGNPNGNVPGYLNQLCLDTVGKVLYICTRAGEALNGGMPLLQAEWTAT